MTLKNNRAPRLCYFKLCASFHSHQSNQTGVTVRKRQIRVKSGNFFVLRDLKICRMTLKTIGHLFYATSSFVHHFISVRKLILELQSGNTKFGSKSAISCPVWVWRIMGHLFYTSSSFMHHSITIYEFKLELQSRNAKIGAIFLTLWPWPLTSDLGFLHAHHFCQW